MRQLDGTRPLVWGGGSGIGFGYALAMRGAGARVVIASRDPNRLAAAATRLGDCPWESADGTVEADVVQTTEAVVGVLGGLDTLVISSGGGGPTPVGATTLAEVRRILEVNLLPVFLAVEAALPHLLAGGGAVIAISSIDGLVGQRERLAYCAAKSDVIGMVRAMALDLAERRVRVNAICPGFVETELAREIAAKEPDPAAALAARRGMHPIPPAGTPAEIGAAAVWLASDAGAWVTGQAIPVDGGYTAR